MKERAKYFSHNDLGAGLQLSYAQEVLETYTPDFVCKDINDAIELHNVKVMISNGMTLVAWKKEQLADYNEKVKLFGKSIVGYFQSLGENPDLSKEVAILERHYHQDFWDMFEGYGQLGLITDDNLRAVLIDYPDEIEDILHCQKIVLQHDSVLKEFLLNYPKATPLLVNAYLKVSDIDFLPLFIPSSLSLQEKSSIIDIYLDGEFVTLGIAQMIATSKDVEGFTLHPKIRLKAKKKAVELNEALQKREDVIRYGLSMSVEFTPEKDVPKEQVRYKDGLASHVYSMEYLNQCDDVQLVDVFREMFHYLDNFGMLKLRSNRREDNFLEKVDMDEWKGMYRNNQMFDYKNKLALGQLSLYVNYLNEKGKTLESLLKNYYENHFKKEYGYPSSQLSLAKDDETFVNKNKVIAPEMEAIVKQYNLFVEEGEIDPELLEISMPLPITLSKSLLKGCHKYAVISESPVEMHRIMWCLFSDQTLLAFVNPYKESRIATLYELLTQKQVLYANFENHQRYHIDFLIGKHILCVDSNGHVHIENMPLVVVLGLLFKNQEVAYWCLDPECRVEIDNMVKNGWLRFDDYLLSPEERKYFNFFLNSTEFSNGPKLRNNYSHGAKSCLESEDEHHVAYFHFLLLLVILLLKMDDDMKMCKYLNEEVKKRQEITR